MPPADDADATSADAVATRHMLIWRCRHAPRHCALYGDAAIAARREEIHVDIAYAGRLPATRYGVYYVYSQCCCRCRAAALPFTLLHYYARCRRCRLITPPYCEMPPPRYVTTYPSRPRHCRAMPCAARFMLPLATPVCVCRLVFLYDSHHRYAIAAIRLCRFIDTPCAIDADCYLLLIDCFYACHADARVC